MTIFKETLDEEFLTISEAKELLSEVEAERALDENRELRFELARAVEHVNRFAVLEPEEAREFVDELLELESIGDEAVAYKIVDLLPGRARNSARCSPGALRARRRRTRRDSRRRCEVRLSCRPFKCRQAYPFV